MPETTSSAEKLLARGPIPDPEEVVVLEVEEPVEETEVEEAEESEEESTEETSEEELPENIKAILAKNRAEAKKAKAELLALKKQLKSEEAKPEESETADRFKTLFINTAATTALNNAGLKSGTDRFLKMLDMDAVEVDEEGNISGLEDQVEALTEEFADLIKSSNTPPRKIVKTDPAGRKETPVAPKTSAEKLLAQAKAKR